jgi:phosphoserine phosphatase RsbU/P
MTLRDRIDLEPVASEVMRLNQWLDAAFARGGVGPSIAADLKLCINEVFANLISYAFGDTVHPEIAVEIELQPHLATAVISDNGAYFDLRTWPAAQKPTSLTDAREGGFGIALIRDRATRIDYDRVGAINRLRITCAGETAASPGKSLLQRLRTALAGLGRSRAR